MKMKSLKILFFVAVPLFFFLSCGAKKTPEQKAAEKEYEEYIYKNAFQSLKDGTFVLEANRIMFKYGNYANVSPNTNFVMGNGNKATIQLAFNTPYAGPNGIGGITVDGNVSNVKLDVSPKGAITYSMNVQGVAVSAQVLIRMHEGSNYCTATVNPTFSGNTITFSGYLYSKDDSSVYKGRSL